ncbi:MAG TPA: hypothetical protein H9865_10780 [Candidatus Fournierella pullicola]|uniref:SGNH hydrolase-type esterase domain-containing protein n=1 Tax=Candidatus Allofournierella pullicola TaxID=2838596 RepID=A0A9D1V5M0_9FIRM|nr:hypothetical protein [Candidatus Fournierella pullicola]
MATYREFREQVKRRRRRKFILRLSLLIVAAAAVCGVAFFALYTVLTGAGWTPDGGQLVTSGSAPASGASQPASSPESGSASGASEPAATWNTSTPVEPTLDQTITGADYRMLAVGANAAVDYSFFDRAAILGDSVSQGWNIYESPMKAHAFICAYKSIGPSAVVNKQTANPGEASGRGEENIYDTIINSNPLRLYILLGTNALVRDGEATEQSFLSYYGQMLDMFKADLGDEVDIYVQSITPVRPGASQPGLYKERIQRVNTQLAVMAREKGCHFVNIYEVLQDENGDLREDLAAADKVHLNQNAYPIMAEYLATHTA